MLPLPDTVVSSRYCAGKAVFELAATAKLTVPFPMPLLPLVIVSQEALLVAVHEQPEVAITLPLPLATLAHIVVDVENRVYEQEAAEVKFAVTLFAPVMVRLQ